MRVVDFAQMVRESVNEKIKDCRSNMHESHNPIYNDSLLVEIKALEWVQGQIQHLALNNNNAQLQQPSKSR
jgi:hypothetical protein